MLEINSYKFEWRLRHCCVETEEFKMSIYPSKCSDWFDYGWSISVTIKGKTPADNKTRLIYDSCVPSDLLDLLHGCVERRLIQPVIDACDERDDVWRYLFTDPTKVIAVLPHDVSKIRPLPVPTDHTEHGGRD